MHQHGTTDFSNNKGGTAMNSDQLVTALQLETIGVMKKGTAYRMVKAGKLIHYKVGCAGGGIRFRVDEVLSALRRPAAERVSGSAVK